MNNIALKTSKALLAIMMFVTLLWSGTVLISSCSSGLDDYDDWIWEDDDSDGWNNGVDEFPSDPQRH